MTLSKGAAPPAACLFCQNGAETRIAEAIRREFPTLTVLFPQYERCERKKGQTVKRTLPLLGGYLFLYGDEPDLVRLYRISGVYRLLQYEDGESRLRGVDMDFAQWLYDNNGRIGLSLALRKGSRVEIVDGPLKHYEGRILELKSHKQQAKVAIEIGDYTRDIWLSFCWIEPNVAETLTSALPQAGEKNKKA